MRFQIFTQNRRLRLPRIFISITIIFSLVFQLGCDRQGAIDLATLGKETGQTLTAYYESLAKDTNDTWDKENLFIALLRRPGQSQNNNVATARPAFDDEDIELLKKRLVAINSRIAMAKQLVAMYTALKDYSSYDSGARVEEATQKLGGALQALLPFPGGINPVTIIAGVAGDLQRWNQQRKIEELTKVSLELIKRLNELFEKEKTAYALVSKENTITKTVIAKQLIDREMVLSWQLLNDIPTTFGLKWSKETENTPVTDEATKKAFGRIIEHRNDVLFELSENAAENIKSALANLVAEQEKFLNKKSFDISQIKAFLERARFYLGEIQKLKASNQPTEEETNG